MSFDFAAAVLVKMTAALGLAWVVTLMLRRGSAAMRHAVWAAGIVAALAMPVLMASLPRWQTPAAHVEAVLRQAPPVLVPGSGQAVREAQAYNAAAMLVVSRAESAAPIPWERIGFAVWALGSLLALGRLGFALLRVRGISGLPMEVDAPRGVRVLEASRADLMPLTWGVFRPLVLFPAGAGEWPRQRFQHVLAHELAHIARRDWGVQMVAEVARAVYWFHPLMWFAASQLRQEAERACDDLVLAQGTTAPDYADDVVGLARTLKTPPGVMSSTFAAANPSKFEERITAMLSRTLNRRPITVRVVVLTFLLAAAVFGPIAALAAGQEIRGKVLEVGTNQPVYEAEIVVRKMGPREYGKPLTSPEVARVKTDSQGEFVFTTSEFGEFILMASKEGYTAAGNVPGGVPPGAIVASGAAPGGLQANVILTAENPAREVAFTMARGATVTGRMLDVESGEPIAGLGVTLMGPNASGSAMFGSFQNMFKYTGTDGTYTVPTTPGSYVMWVTPRRMFKGQVMTTFTADDVRATDLDYRSVYLPGGPDYSTALPIPVISGGTADVGVLRLRKERLYRVHVTIGGTCAPGEEIPLSVTMHFGPRSWTNDLGSFACRSEILLRDMAPGEYLLVARVGKDAATRVMAAAPFEIRESNMEIPLTLGRGVNLDGRIVAAEGAGKLPMDRLDLQMTGVDIPNYAGEIGPYKPDAEGRFQVQNAMPGHRQLSMIGLNNEFYVKEIRQQGRPVAGTIVDATADGSLEIVIDSNPASLSGSVRVGDRAVANATVILSAWPTATGTFGIATRRVVADEKGEFHVAGLVPGDYRVFAVAASDVPAASSLAKLPRLLTSAQAVKLARGGTETVTLRPVDPAR